MNSARDKGFTLLELVVVITIISIITGAVVPTFSTYMRNQNLKQAQEKLKSDIRTVQNRALTGSMSDQLIGSVPAAFWGIRFTSGSPTYQYFISIDKTLTQCINENYKDGVNGIQQGSEALPQGISLRSTGCLFFDFKNGSVSAYSVSNLGARIVYLGYTGMSGNNCRRIMWTDNGAIYSNNNLACPL